MFRDGHSGIRARGMTLAEVMVATVVLMVAALGSLRCQYYATGHGRTARAQIAAARVAQLLIEDWKSTGGSTEYDPFALGLGFSSARAIPDGFTTAAGLGAVLNDGVYAISIDGTPMLIMLKYLDVNEDGLAAAALRQLAVIVRFVEGGDTGDDRLVDMDPMTLVTYVRLDGSSG